VRLDGFLKKEEGFVKGLQKCLDKFGELNKTLERLKMEADPNQFENLLNIRLEAINAFSAALIKMCG